MSDTVPQTPSQEPGATGGDQPTGDQPAATNPQGGDGATNDYTVTLSQEDYKNLVAARDRANNNNSDTDAIVNDLLKKDSINEFLAKNKETYPDITFEDLAAAESPDELEEIAKSRQQRYEDVVQKKLMDVQRADAPVLSTEERAAELKKLRENPKKGSFGRMLELEQQGT